MKLKQQLDTNIMVKAPYNIIYDLSKTSETRISGKVKNEFSLPYEDGSISAAEAGRHLAILGSIALSLTRDTPQYHLAVAAEITRHSLNCTPSDTLYIASDVNSQNERKGLTTGYLYNDAQELIYDIKVTYKILSVPLFSKLFKNYYKPDSIAAKNDAYSTRRALSNVTIKDKSINADYGNVASEDCMGHFNDYPALPVAIICGAFTNLGLQLFFHHFGSTYKKAVATHAIINAKRLVFADEILTYQGDIQSTTQNTVKVYFEGLVEGKKVADASFEICGVLGINTLE